MWAYPSEILPLRIRQRGSALSVVWQWLITFLVVEITPVGIQNIGWKLYIVFCILNWASIIVVWFWYPETSGKTLESIDFLFASQTSLTQVVKLSKRRDIDDMAIAHELQAQVHRDKAEEKRMAYQENERQVPRNQRGEKHNNLTITNLADSVFEGTQIAG